ncbi:multiheme c-type cytochrome [Sunxiuqinia sp. sy24]|uniref:multiheme c-type cytochrome n=1 Tax=Sunxiuqinia sp. sy24 TaxID=3461495 RepID=UPI004045F7F0
MKLREITKLLFVASLVLLLIPACVKEGPQGLAGVDGEDGLDGADGADGHVTCLVCHGGENIEAIQGQFAMSVHKSGVNAVAYAGARADCAQCHSHEGFVQFAEFGEVFGAITSPNAWECGTCHGLHNSFESGDYALRLSDPVNPIFDETVTMDLMGNSNLCANCHQSRRPEPSIDKPGDTYKITSTHYGPHHGAQANVVAGVGFAEIEGSTSYPDAGSNLHLAQASCVGCHMGEFADGQGGHSWNPSVNACNECHEADETDFNYGGVQTDIHDKLIELRDLLIARGVVSGDDQAGYGPVVGTYPMIEARAFFNWAGLEEDRSLGVHNPKYVRALLNNTIEALETAVPAN